MQIVARHVPAAPPAVFPALCVAQQSEAHEPRAEALTREKFVIKRYPALFTIPWVFELHVEVPEEMVVVDRESGCADAPKAIAEQKQIFERVREIGGHDVGPKLDGEGHRVRDDERVGGLKSLVDARAVLPVSAAAGPVEEVAACSRGRHFGMEIWGVAF